MAGITDGVPEVAVGEPIRLGNNGEYELEHDPITDRLIVRDTVNGTEAYVRPETNERIGYQGAFIRSLVNGEPLADDGRLYSTVQAAERAANGWVFLPPKSYTETASIDTEGLHLIGAGYGTHLDSTSDTVVIRADGVHIRNMRISSSSGNPVSAPNQQDDGVIDQIWITTASSSALNIGPSGSSGWRVLNSYILDGGGNGINMHKEGLVYGCYFGSAIGDNGINCHDDCIIANNHFTGGGANRHAIFTDDNDVIIIGNRIHNWDDVGVKINGGVDCIVANNRISNCADANISDTGTNTALDANLTGASN